MRTIWFLAFPDSEVLDLAGPWSAFGYANEALGREAYKLKLASPEPGAVTTRHGLAIAHAQPLDAMLEGPPPHTVIVSGGAPQFPLPAPEAAAAAWLSLHGQRFERIASVCTGAFVLGAAGLLDERRATTHWLYRDALRNAFPAARVADDDIFLRAGKVWTSAGITAGIDLSLAMIEEDCGHAVAIAVAKGLVLFLRRPGRQAQFSHVLRRQEAEPAPASDLRALIGAHLAGDLSVDRLASLAGMSPRSLTRFCTRTFNEAPAGLIRRSRLEEAQRMLEDTDLPLKCVAAQSGLGDPATLWRVFRDHFSVSPADYRARFR